MKTAYSGAGWVRRSLGIEEMSPLGEKVADLIGYVFRGIYHLRSASLGKVDWADKHVITIVIDDDSFSTVDFNKLTELVVLTHEEMLRMHVRGAAPGYLRLVFHQRKTREGGIMERIPTMEKHTEEIKGGYFKHATKEMPE